VLEIVITRDDANSESALLVEWLVGHGEPVSKGQLVCVIETSKSAVEIESPGDGTLVQLAREGDDVELGRRIAVIAAGADEVAELERQRERRPAPAPAAGVTRRALELAAGHGIDVAAIVKPGFVTAEDVQALIDADRPADAGLLGGVSVDGVSLPASLGLDDTVGVLDAAFFSELRADPDAVRALTPAERTELYRRHGARIGAGVRLGERTVIVSPRIVLDDGAEVGDDSTLQCDDVLCLGALTKLGPRLRLRCRRTFIGAGGYVGDDVQIGGGGASDPQALLVIGDLVFVGAEVFVNPGRPVILGREVFLTMRSVIVTHNIGQSVLEGFENRFAPVVLEDRAQVGIGAVVYAGCRIGQESIVGSNSYVVADIPAGKLATGVPARVVGSAHRTITPARRTELARKLVADLQEQLALGGQDVVPAADGFAIAAAGKTAHVVFVERLDASFAPPSVDGETIVLTLELAGEPPPGCAVLDLIGRRVYGPGGVVVESAREFCRKRGIRFEPGPWRYRAGLL
jgi:acetyltransferase-like isoleucine patch superfamily enzyme